MIFSIPIPFPIPLPKWVADGTGGFVIHHRDTEAQSHRSIANTKTQRHEGFTKSSQTEPSQFVFSGRRGTGRAFKNVAPTQEMTSVFLCAPLCLCVERPTAAPEIGAPQ
jgi:hypothetical protein